MSNAQNLAYSIVQILHNFGAVAAVAGSLSATRTRDAVTTEKLAWLTFAGWGTQGASGAAFGAVSYYYYGRFPDIAGIAFTALLIKMASAATGFLLVAAYLYRGAGWTERGRNMAWHTSSTLAVIALMAAAFLRWFS